MRICEKLQAQLRGKILNRLASIRLNRDQRRDKCEYIVYLLDVYVLQLESMMTCSPRARVGSTALLTDSLHSTRL